MVFPAKSNRIQANMYNLLTIPTHANPVNMMDLCRLVANRAATVGQTEIQVFADVVRLIEQTVFGRHRPVKAELYQICEKVFGGGHVRIRQTESIPVTATAEIPCKQLTNAFRFITRPDCYVPNDGKDFFALVDRYATAVIQPDLNPGWLLLIQIVANILVRKNDQFFPLSLKNLRCDYHRGPPYVRASE